MAAQTGTFTATGVSPYFQMGAAGDVPWSVSGTFVGKVVLERSVTPSMIAWEPAHLVPTISAPVSGVLRGTPKGAYRFRCSSFTSGTITYSITTTAAAPATSQFSNLPTTLPADAGVLWNDGGVLSIT